MEIRSGWVDVEVAGVDGLVDGVLERFGRGLERRVKGRVVACACAGAGSGVRVGLGKKAVRFEALKMLRRQR